MVVRCGKQASDVDLAFIILNQTKLLQPRGHLRHGAPDFGTTECFFGDANCILIVPRRQQTSEALKWSLRALALTSGCIGVGFIIFACVLQNPPETSLPM